MCPILPHRNQALVPNKHSPLWDCPHLPQDLHFRWTFQPLPFQGKNLFTLAFEFPEKAELPEFLLNRGLFWTPYEPLPELQPVRFTFLGFLPSWTLLLRRHSSTCWACTINLPDPCCQATWLPDNLLLYPQTLQSQTCSFRPCFFANREELFNFVFPLFSRKKPLQKGILENIPSDKDFP